MKLAYYWMTKENADHALVCGTLANQEPVGRINALDVRELRVTDGHDFDGWVSENRLSAIGMLTASELDEYLRQAREQIENLI